MIRFLILIIAIVLILFMLKNARKRTNSNNSNLYKNLILITLFIGVMFLLVTSGKFILPQVLQILKIGLPFLTKFIGI